jgi:hypothetical protein
MRLFCGILGSLDCLSTIVSGCGPLHFDPIQQAPDEPEPPDPPDGPAPTGRIGDQVTYDADRGRASLG